MANFIFGDRTAFAVEAERPGEVCTLRAIFLAGGETLHHTRAAFGSVGSGTVWVGLRAGRGIRGGGRNVLIDDSLSKRHERRLFKPKSSSTSFA